MVLREKQLGGDNVFSNPADILPWKCRCFDLDAFFIQFVDIFDHDDRIGILWQDMARVDVKGIPVDDKLLGCCGACAKGDFCF